MVRLRNGRNRVVPVNRLPLELLQIIFRYAGDYGHNQRTAFAITWTCALWRSVAVAEEALWTLIVAPNNAHRHLLDISLKRVRSLPFTVSCKGWYPLKSVEKALSQGRGAGQVTGVSLWCAVEDDFYQYQDALKGLDRVKSLSISLEKDYENDEDDPSDIIVFNDEISQDLPCLEELSLSRCRFFWDAAIYTGLTHLSVTFMGIWPNWEKEGDFLQVCRHSPNLRTLKLAIYRRGVFESCDLVYHAYKDWLKAHSTPLAPCHMPSLVDITLDLPSAYLLYFLRSVTFPIGNVAQFDLRSNCTDCEPTEPSWKAANITLKTLFKDFTLMQLMQKTPTIAFKVASHRHTSFYMEGHHPNGALYRLRIRENGGYGPYYAPCESDDAFLGPSEIVQYGLSIHTYVVNFRGIGPDRWRHQYSDVISSLTRHAAVCFPMITKLTIEGDGCIWDPALWDLLVKNIDEAAKETPPSSWKLKTVHVFTTEIDDQYARSTRPTVEQAHQLVRLYKHLTDLGCNLEELIIDCYVLVASTEENALSFAKEIFELNTPQLSWANTVFTTPDNAWIRTPLRGVRAIPSQYWRRRQA